MYKLIPDKCFGEMGDFCSFLQTEYKVSKAIYANPSSFGGIFPFYGQILPFWSEFRLRHF